MITLMSSEDFDSMYSIMDMSFPDDEYRPRDEQKTLLSNPLYKVYVKTESGAVSGFIAVWEFDSFLFVEHFAVNPDNRSCGLGSSMLSDIKSVYQKRICLEVEPPENEMTKRRIAFYERNGFSLNDYPYMQPPISKGKKSVPLMLMTTQGMATPSELDSIKNTLYKYVYKV